MLCAFIRTSRLRFLDALCAGGVFLFFFLLIIIIHQPDRAYDTQRLINTRAPELVIKIVLTVTACVERRVEKDRRAE